MILVRVIFLYLQCKLWQYDKQANIQFLATGLGSLFVSPLPQASILPSIILHHLFQTGPHELFRWEVCCREIPTCLAIALFKCESSGEAMEAENYPSDGLAFSSLLRWGQSASSMLASSVTAMAPNKVVVSQSVLAMRGLNVIPPYHLEDILDFPKDVSGGQSGGNG